MWLGVVAQICDHSTLVAEAEKSLWVWSHPELQVSFKPGWSIDRVSQQPGLCRETPSRTKKTRTAKTQAFEWVGGHRMRQRLGRRKGGGKIPLSDNQRSETFSKVIWLGVGKKQLPDPASLVGGWKPAESIHRGSLVWQYLSRISHLPLTQHFQTCILKNTRKWDEELRLFSVCVL